MTQLSAKDLRGVLSFADTALAVSGFAEVESVLLPGLGELAGSDMAVCHLLDLAHGEEVDVAWPSDVFTPQGLEGYGAVMPEHPLVRHYQSAPHSCHPVRVSDLMTRRAWRSSRVYQDSHKGLGVDDQLAVMGCGETSGLGFSMSRSGREYSDREAALIALATPHVLAAVVRARSNPSLYPALQVAPQVRYVQVGGGPDARGEEVGAVSDLTPREREVLDLVAAGLASKQVARRLEVSVRTVHKHLEHAYAKLGVDNRVAAVQRSLGSGQRPQS